MSERFNEQSLLSAVVERWGEYGAHADVCRFMIDEITSLRAENERLQAVVDAQHTAHHQAMWQDTLIPIANAVGVDLVDEHGELRRHFQMVDAIIAHVCCSTERAALDASEDPGD